MYIWVCVFSAVPLFMRFYYIVFFILIQINKNMFSFVLHFLSISQFVNIIKSRTTNHNLVAVCRLNKHFSDFILVEEILLHI